MKRFIITIAVEVEAESLAEAQHEAAGCITMLDPTPTGDTTLVSINEKEGQ